MDPSKTAVFRIVAVCLGLFVGLAAGEIAARSLALAPPLEGQYSDNVRDVYLPYKRKPLSRKMGRNETNEFDYDYQHNSFGLRDVEHAIIKREGTFRILGLGDSFTYGVGVPFEDTYLSRLEERLNNRAGAHPRVEVIKAGIPRYFPEPERILLEKYGVQFQPDLILVGFLPNDVIDTYLGLDAVKVDQSGYLKTREAEELGQLGTQVYQYCHLCRVPLRSYVSWQIERKYRPRANELFQDGGFHERDWVQVEREYDQMVEIAASIGARFVILHIPQKGPWTEKERYPAVRLSSWAATRNVGFVDLLPAMERASSRQRLYYETDGHCTPAGQAVIAQELYKHLTDHNIIP
jgi:lysophospholipase L1-like esterase